MSLQKFNLCHVIIRDGKHWTILATDVNIAFATLDYLEFLNGRVTATRFEEETKLFAVCVLQHSNTSLICTQL
jgi:hypothetical protein